MSCDTGTEASNAATFNHRSGNPVNGDPINGHPVNGEPINGRTAARRNARHPTHRRPATISSGTGAGAGDGPSAMPHATNTRRPEGHTQRPEGHTQRHAGRNRGPHLSTPTMDDLTDLHTLFADPRTWWNTPNHRHNDIVQTRALLERWMDDWEQYGIGYWVMRDNRSGRFLGAGGIRRTGDILSMRYYIPPRLWHRGYGSYLAASAQEVAALYDAALPIFLASLARNHASCMIADKLGFVVVRRDVDFTADAASRRIYADRPVSLHDLTDYLNIRERI
ncbi:GNAT family N-acetyltransferase [Bifidobacterium parmae]|uniref:N-acetyltransferase GCN5 n=1 Tax=Bifidobacterium parmae TaxID=361854 RepID=A0A2N5J4R4_9BIFI|nr:GNAT family N-acetyltransferase [Bifidobacterium parmae]PLS29214.1 N-acetyltransferase GCN5 [Bifidobacterium parmae]